MAKENQVKHEATNVSPLTTESLIEKYADIVEAPIVDEEVTLPDGSVHGVKVRRLTPAEIYASFGQFVIFAYRNTQDNSENQSPPAFLNDKEQTTLSLQIMQEAVIIGMEEPKFKYQDAEGPGCPVESIHFSMLNAFHAVVKKVNLPPEVESFIDMFLGTGTNGNREAVDNHDIQESENILPEAE